MSELTTIEDKGLSTSRTSSVHPGAMIHALLERPDIDLDKLEKFYALQQKYEDNEARKAFHKSMARFVSLVPEIHKNRLASFKTKTGHTEYEWADLAGIIHAIKSPEEECGLSHHWEVEQLDGGLIKVTCFVTHELGYQKHTSLQNSRDESGSKNNIQAMGSTIEYLKRYTLKMLLGLADAEADNDGHTEVKMITEHDAANIEALISEVSADKSAFLKYMGVSSVMEIPLRSLAKATNALQAKRKQS